MPIKKESIEKILFVIEIIESTCKNNLHDLKRRGN